jgi:hypothetical protein
MGSRGAVFRPSAVSGLSLCPALSTTSMAAGSTDHVFAGKLVAVLAMGARTIERSGLIDSILNIVVSGFKMVRRDDFIPRLSLVMPDGNERATNAVGFGKFNGRVGDALRVDDLVCSGRVQQLRASSGPATIGWLVISSLIREAVKRVFWGRFIAHVGHEVPEASTTNRPTLANRNSLAAVVLVSSGVRVFAASMHVRPSVIKRVVHSVIHSRNLNDFVKARQGV